MFSGVFLLCLSVWPASAREPIKRHDVQASIAGYSRSALAGLQLASNWQFRQGLIGYLQYRCIEVLAPKHFDEAVFGLLQQFLTEDELLITEKFMTTRAGQKVARMGALAVYSALGEPLPEPMPSLSDDEMKLHDEFLLTSAGTKLMTLKVFSGADARASLRTATTEVMAQCSKTITSPTHD